MAIDFGGCGTWKVEAGRLGTQDQPYLYID